MNKLDKKELVAIKGGMELRAIGESTYFYGAIEAGDAPLQWQLNTQYGYGQPDDPNGVLGFKVEIEG